MTKKVIIAKHQNDERTYLWEYDEYLYDMYIGKYAIVDSNNQLQVVQIVGFGEVDASMELKKCYEIVELDNVTI